MKKSEDEKKKGTISMNLNMKKNFKTLFAVIIGLSLVISPVNVSELFAQGISLTTDWTREAASQIRLDDSNRAPKIDKDELQEITSDFIIWDTWPLQDKNGHPAVVNGYKIIFALSVPKGTIPGKRHDIAEIRYFYSKDGKSWGLGGLVFKEDQALGSRQWAGSSIVDKNGRVHMFYTATGQKGEKQLSYGQKLAAASADILTNQKSVMFANWSEHKIILEADGTSYQTEQQAGQGEFSYAFRDPYYFLDPKTGEEYLLFSANSSGTLEERACREQHAGSSEFMQTMPQEAKFYNGSIGIAKAANKGLTEFTLLPPLLEANCVNEELERPNVMVKGNHYYLFAKTHSNKFAQGIEAPEGLYGFVSEVLTGEYTPLNGSGLVIGNPENNPYQSYSWMVMSNGTVISYVDYVDVDGKDIHEIGEQSPEYQIEHFGGMLAPSIKLQINRDQTILLSEKKQGVFK
ncbi:glycoside hydrolase family 68 protein [Paenibacillus tarimensis]